MICTTKNIYSGTSLIRKHWSRPKYVRKSNISDCYFSHWFGSSRQWNAPIIAHRLPLFLMGSVGDLTSPLIWFDSKTNRNVDRKNNRMGADRKSLANCNYSGDAAAELSTTSAATGHLIDYSVYTMIKVADADSIC